MGKSKSNSGSQRSNFFEKALDHGYSAVLSFILTTALVGGSSYILFTMPNEENALNRKTKEFGNQKFEI